MATDGLIKSLLVQKHQVFIRLMGMDDIIELLQQQKHLEELQDRIKAGRAQGETPRQEVVNVAIVASKRAKAHRTWHQVIASWQD